VLSFCTFNFSRKHKKIFKNPGVHNYFIVQPMMI
jgi:hypothetical protein